MNTDDNDSIARQHYYEQPQVDNTGIVLTVDQLYQITDKRIEWRTAELYSFYINRRLGTYKINNRLRLAHFLAQVLHESAMLKSTREILNYNFPKRSEEDSTRLLMNTFSGLRLKKVESPMGPYLYTTYPNRPGPKAYKKLASIDEKRTSYQVANAALHDRETFERYVYGGYSGRGLIHLTWMENYKHFSEYTGIDYVKHKEWLESPQDAVESALWFWTGSRHPVRGCLMFHGK